LIFGGSPRTLPTGADEAGGTAVKFYELRDNLRSGLGTRHSDAPAFANVPRAAVLRANYY